MSEPRSGDREVAERCVHLLPLPAALHVAWYRERCEAAARAAERVKVLAEVEALIERFSYVATFDDGTQERVLLSAALETSLRGDQSGEAQAAPASSFASSRVVSEPGAAITITAMSLTPEAAGRLTTNGATIPPSTEKR